MSAAAGSKQWDYLEQIDNSFISQNYSLFKARGMENSCTYFTAVVQ